MILGGCRPPDPLRGAWGAAAPQEHLFRGVWGAGAPQGETKNKKCSLFVSKVRKFIGFGAMDVTKPYKFTGFGAMDVTKPHKFIGFVAGGGPDWAPSGCPGESSKFANLHFTPPQMDR